jgi:hypothetical protein
MEVFMDYEFREDEGLLFRVDNKTGDVEVWSPFEGWRLYHDPGRFTYAATLEEATALIRQQGGTKQKLFLPLGSPVLKRPRPYAFLELDMVLYRDRVPDGIERWDATRRCWVADVADSWKVRDEGRPALSRADATELVTMQGGALRALYLPTGTPHVPARGRQVGRRRSA